MHLKATNLKRGPGIRTPGLFFKKNHKKFENELNIVSVEIFWCPFQQKSLKSGLFGYIRRWPYILD